MHEGHKRPPAASMQALYIRQDLQDASGLPQLGRTRLSQQQQPHELACTLAADVHALNRCARKPFPPSTP